MNDNTPRLYSGLSPSQSRYVESPRDFIEVANEVFRQDQLLASTKFSSCDITSMTSNYTSRSNLKAMKDGCSGISGSQSHYVESPTDFIQVANTVFQLDRPISRTTSTSCGKTSITGGCITVSNTNATKQSKPRVNTIDAKELNCVVAAAIRKRNNARSNTASKGSSHRFSIEAESSENNSIDAEIYESNALTSSKYRPNGGNYGYTRDRYTSNTNASIDAENLNDSGNSDDTEVCGVDFNVNGDQDDHRPSLFQNDWLTLRFTWGTHHPIYIRFRIRKRAPFRDAMCAVASRLGFRHADCLKFMRVRNSKGCGASDDYIGPNETAEVMQLQTDDEIRVTRSHGVRTLRSSKDSNELEFDNTVECRQTEDGIRVLESNAYLAANQKMCSNDYTYTPQNDTSTIIKFSHSVS